MNVINFSGGGPETDPANDAMNEAVHNTALAGVVPVIAAGNDREDFGLGSAGSPGTAPDAISVAATSNSHVFAPALTVTGGPPSLGAVPIQGAGGAKLPTAWSSADQTIVDVSSVLGTDGKPVDTHLCGSATDPNGSLGTIVKDSLAGKIALVSRGICTFASKAARAAIGGANGHRRDRQPLRRGEPDPDSAAAPDRDDLRPRRREPSRLRGRARRSGVDPGLDRHPGAPDESQRRDHQLLVGRPDRLRPLPEAGLSAPGLDVLSSTPPLTTGSTFSVFAGTSMATPHVAGAAALLLQQHPGWSSWQVKSALMSTSGPAWGDTARTQEAPVLLEGAGLANVAAANDPKIFTDPQSLSFQRIDVSTGAQRRSTLLTLADAGDGFGTWSAAVAPQAADRRRHDRRSGPVDDRARRRRRRSRSSSVSPPTRRRARTTASSS